LHFNRKAPRPKIEHMETVILNGQALTLAEIEAVSLHECKVEIAAAALDRVDASRELIEGFWPRDRRFTA